MKNFTLILIGMVLGATLTTQSLYSRTPDFPDGSMHGIEEKEQELKVFPNPSDGRFQLTLTIEESEKVTAKVYDITGKQVKDITEDLVIDHSSVTAQVNLESPKSGIYFLRVSIGSKVLTKKIIIR